MMRADKELLGRVVIIGNPERKRRSSETLLIKNIASEHRIKQWKKVLGSASNKTALIQLLFNEWSK